MREEELELSFKELKYLLAVKMGRFAKEAKNKWTGSQRKLKRQGRYGKWREGVL